MPVSAEYNSLSKWDASRGTPELEVMYFKVIQNILMREGALVKFTSIAESLDTQYWKYAVLKMKAGAKKQLNNSESLVAKRKVIRSLQMELTVSLAHIRGASAAVVESVHTWRNTKKSSNLVKTKETVSVFWQGENYLLKMFTDFEILCERFYTIRLWLGFHPNSLVLPPTKPVPINSTNAAFLRSQNIAQNPNSTYFTLVRNSSVTIPNSPSSPSRRPSLKLPPSTPEGVTRRSTMGINITFNLQEFNHLSNINPLEYDAKIVWENEHFTHYLLWTKRKQDRQWEKDRQKRLIGQNGVADITDVTTPSATFPIFLSESFPACNVRQLYAPGTRDAIVFPDQHKAPTITTINDLKNKLSKLHSMSHHTSGSTGSSGVGVGGLLGVVLSATTTTTNIDNTGGGGTAVTTTDNNNNNTTDITGTGAGTGVIPPTDPDLDYYPDPPKKKMKSYKELSFFYSNSEVADLLPSVLDGTDGTLDDMISFKKSTSTEKSNLHSFLGDILLGDLDRSRSHSKASIPVFDSMGNVLSMVQKNTIYGALSTGQSTPGTPSPKGTHTASGGRTPSGKMTPTGILTPGTGTAPGSRSVSRSVSRSASVTPTGNRSRCNSATRSPTGSRSRASSRVGGRITFGENVVGERGRSEEREETLGIDNSVWEERDDDDIPTLGPRSGGGGNIITVEEGGVEGEREGDGEGGSDGDVKEGSGKDKEGKESNSKFRRLSRKLSAILKLTNNDAEIDEMYEDTEQWMYVLKTLCNFSWKKCSNKDLEKEGEKGRESEKENDISVNYENIILKNEKNEKIKMNQNMNLDNVMKDSNNYDKEFIDNYRKINDEKQKSENNENNDFSAYKQGLNEVPQFWSNLDLNSVIIEAAIGFPEIYPLQPFVPPLHPKLYKNIEHLIKLIYEEKIQCDELEDRKIKARELEIEITESVGPESLLVSILQF